MQSLNISTAALRGVQQALDTTANNLANIDTVGYKRRTASFSELLSDSMNEQPVADKENRNTPAGLRVGSGARLGLTKLDLDQGSAKQTDVPTDLMIEGEGYFLITKQIKDANGAVIKEENRLTRSGGFHVQKDDDQGGYVLHTPSGHILTDNNGVPFVLAEPVQNIQVSKDGVLSANGTEYGTIGIWKVDNPDQLQQIGENQYDAQLDTGVNPSTKYTSAIDEQLATIRQGALEASNVDMTEEMSQLVNIQRAYQFNSRAIGISDQMMGIANSIRSR